MDRTVRSLQTLNQAKLSASAIASASATGTEIDTEIKANVNVICRRLPLQEYVPDRATHVLNVDCCVHILCMFMETRDWKETFRVTLPQRKIVRGGKKERTRRNKEMSKEGGDRGVDEDGDGDEDEEGNAALALTGSVEAMSQNSRWQRWVTREVGLHRWPDDEQEKEQEHGKTQNK